ncbi:MAG: TRAM domain-containing protein, partial [Bacteroidota bacterium]
KQQKHSLARNKRDVGRRHKILVEGFSKRSTDHLQGRNSANKVVIFPKGNFKKGDYVDVLVNDCSAATLLGNAV